MLIGPPEHRLSQPGPAPIRALKTESIVLPLGPSPMRDTFLRLATDGGINPRIAWEVRNLEAQIQAVISGIGITPTMMEVVASRVAAGQVSVLNVEGFPFRFDLTMVRRPQPLSPAAEALRAHLVRADDDKGA